MPGIVDFDTGEIDRLNEVFADAASKDVDLSFSMGEAVRIIKKGSTANFILSGSGKYVPLSPKYVLRKSRIAPGKPILVLTERLKKSVLGNTTDSINEQTKSSARVGTTTPYAAWVQDGTENKDGTVKMPARPFLILTASMVDAIANTVGDDVFGQLGSDLDGV